MKDPERVLRQVLLVGEGGQRAIERAVAPVAGEGPACAVAVRYAERAGFGAIAAAPLEETGAPEASAPELDPACHAVLEGSRAAMRAILRALDAAATSPASRSGE